MTYRQKKDPVNQRLTGSRVPGKRNNQVFSEQLSYSQYCWLVGWVLTNLGLAGLILIGLGLGNDTSLITGFHEDAHISILFQEDILVRLIRITADLVANVHSVEFSFRYTQPAVTRVLNKCKGSHNIMSS